MRITRNKKTATDSMKCRWCFAVINPGDVYYSVEVKADLYNLLYNAHYECEAFCKAFVPYVHEEANNARFCQALRWEFFHRKRVSSSGMRLHDMAKAVIGG